MVLCFIAGTVPVSAKTRYTTAKSRTKYEKDHKIGSSNYLKSVGGTNRITVAIKGKNNKYESGGYVFWKCPEDGKYKFRLQSSYFTINKKKSLNPIKAATDEINDALNYSLTGKVYVQCYRYNKKKKTYKDLKNSFTMDIDNSQNYDKKANPHGYNSYSPKSEGESFKKGDLVVFYFDGVLINKNDGKRADGTYTYDFDIMKMGSGYFYP